jgi:glutamate dehydrogenase (NAD(P)+)
VAVQGLGNVGSTVSYFEWVQNNENEQWDLEEVNAGLKRKLCAEVYRVLERRRMLGEETAPGLPAPDLRTTTMTQAIERVAHATLERGIWP